MLQDIRDKSSGIIAAILIGSLVVIFALFGTDTLFKNYITQSKSLKVNDQSFSEQDIDRAIAQKRQQIMNQYGDQVPQDLVKDEALRGPAVNGLIQRALLNQAARKAGLVTNANVLSEQIVEAFKKDGKFDQERFEQIARMQGYGVMEFKNLIATELATEQLHSSLTASAFITPSEVQRLMALAFQTRSFNYLLISADKVEKQVVIDDKDLKTYYDANPKTYTTSEQVAVDYLDLSVADLMANVQVSEEQIKKQYEQNLKNFVEKPERQAAHILLAAADQKAIDEVKAKLAAGEDFAKLAKAYSTDAGSKEQGGDLGFSSGDVFPPEFEAALAKLKVGEVSAPVKTDAGVSFVKLLSMRGTKAPSLDESRPTIIEQLKRADAENQFIAKREKMKELSFNADKLADVAKELNLPVKNTGLFDKTNGKDVAANKLFIDAAFSADVIQQGNSSELIDFNKDRTLVVKKTDYKPAALQSFDVVKDQVTQAVKKEKIHALLEQQAKSIANTVNAGGSLVDQAKALSVEVKAAENIGRNDAQVPRDLLQFAFSMAQPTDKPYASTTAVASGEYAVVLLNKVTLATDDKPAEQKAAINAQLAAMQGESEFKAYSQSLEDSATIKRK